MLIVLYRTILYWTNILNLLYWTTIGKIFLYKKWTTKKKLQQICVAGKFSKRFSSRCGVKRLTDVSSPRRVNATKRLAALHICDPKSAEKSMPRRRVSRILYVYIVFIYNRRWTTIPFLVARSENGSNLSN